MKQITSYKKRFMKQTVTQRREEIEKNRKEKEEEREKDKEKNK